MFPWGRPLETARRFAVYFGILAFLTVCAAGAIFWAHRSERVDPYFIYAGPGNEWLVFSTLPRRAPPSPAWRLVQESMVVKYAVDYFRITGDMAGNSAVLWCGCSQASCAEDWNQCKICCASGDKAFKEFKAVILPLWIEKFDRGQTMELGNVAARPIGRVLPTGGTWEITGELVESSEKTRLITAYAKVERLGDGHMQTAGFRIAEFHFYAEDKDGRAAEGAKR